MRRRDWLRRMGWSLPFLPSLPAILSRPSLLERIQGEVGAVYPLAARARWFGREPLNLVRLGRPVDGWDGYLIVPGRHPRMVALLDYAGRRFRALEGPTAGTTQRATQSYWTRFTRYFTLDHSAVGWRTDGAPAGLRVR